MRARPLTLLTATAAVLLVVAGGLRGEGAGQGARARGYTRARPAPPSRSRCHRSWPNCCSRHYAGRGITRRRRSADLQARIQQATDEAAAGGATLSVAVLDRNTHQLVSNGNSQIVGTASVAKLFIADDLLLHEAQGKTALSPDDRQALDIMLRSSDDGAAERFWDQGGGDAIITDGRGPVRADVDHAAQRRALVEHDELGDGPDPLLRHAARRVRRAAGRAGQDHRQRPGPVHPQRDRRLPAAVRHSRRAVRRTGGGQAGLDVLHRQPTGCICRPA